MLDRAYSLLTIKSVDAERRLITGTASTPEPDRVGDVMEPKGMQFRNPIPLLLYHDTKKPVGEVWLTPGPDGVDFKASIPDVTEPGIIRDRVNEAWHSAKYRLLKGASIGFRELDGAVERIKSGGLRYLKSEILELSMVAIPANASATIQTIKSLDVGLAAPGTESEVGSSQVSAGVSAHPVVRMARKDASTMKTTIQERITGFEATRQAKSARLNEIQEAVGEAGRTKDASEKEEFDTVKAEIDSIDSELKDLRDMETMAVKDATRVVGKTKEEGSDTRGAVVVDVKSNLPKGTGFTRYAMALAAGRGSRLEAAEYAKRWEKSTPEVAMILKAAVTAGTTTDSDWAAPLVVYQNLASEFVELLRPATIIGRIAGLRRVPFNVTMPNQTQGATVGWVGQGKPKQVSELKFTQLSLGMAKAAGIVVLSEELVRSSSPSAEAVVRGDLISTIAAFLDVQFVDPSVAAVTNVSPAAITNGITPVDSTGVTAAFFRADFKTMAAAMIAAGISSLSGGHWIMTETQALAFSLMQNALGQSEFPGMAMTGGTLLGFPVVASEAVPAEGGSPAGNRIIFVLPREIFVADEGGVAIDVSREASLQMNSAPDDPATASTVYVSLWQNNLVGLRAERFINWMRRRDAAVGIIEGAVYTG